MRQDSGLSRVTQSVALVALMALSPSCSSSNFAGNIGTSKDGPKKDKESERAADASKIDSKDGVVEGEPTEEETFVDSADDDGSGDGDGDSDSASGDTDSASDEASTDGIQTDEDVDIAHIDPFEIDDDEDFDADNNGLLEDEEILKLRQACWFAVSGTWGGSLGYYPTAATTFPKTMDNELPTHGKKFDTLGGVFLNARADPYVYKQGGREIDGAVNNTFDSISIAPNMKAEIRNGTGTLIAEIDGPYLGIETQYAQNATKVIAQVKDRTDMPKWFRTLIKTSNPIKSLKLQAARSVKVTPKTGSRCDTNR